MKRSSMVKEIELLITECIQDGFNWAETSEAILHVLEEHGMCPPNQYACTNEFRFEWEPEDEEK